MALHKSMHSLESGLVRPVREGAQVPYLHGALETKIQQSRESLDAWVREIIQWHFDPATGCPFWLNYAERLSWDPRKEIQTYDDLSRLGPFQDEWLRGGPVRRWVPKGFAGQPVYTFET